MSKSPKHKVVLIADSHEFFRNQYHSYLDDDFDLHVLEKIEVDSVEKAIVAHRPDAIIIDTNMGKMIQIVEKLDKEYGWLPVLIFSCEFVESDDNRLYGIEIFNKYKGVTALGKGDIGPRDLPLKLSEIIHKS